MVAILLQFNLRSLQYKTQKFAIIAHQKEVNCRCSERTIQRLMERHDKGLPIVGEFTSVGQPAYCTDDDIQQLVERGLNESMLEEQYPAWVYRSRHY